jgi:hypothetical protein
MMRVRFIIVFLLLVASHSVSYSQDIYWLRYRSPQPKDTTGYDAFFSLSANGTGIVRINPVNANYTVEMDIEENYVSGKDGNPDLSYVFYQGKNPRVVKGNSKIKFVPVTFWFKINPDNFYDPWGVTDVSANMAPAQNNFKSVELINSQELVQKRDLVTTFFADTSTYYKHIFSPKARGGMLSPEEKQNTHMYLIVVASTNDPSLQPNCLQDANKVINFFSEMDTTVLGLLPRNLIIYPILGNNYSKTNVEDVLKKIKPTKNDLVIFYYSGHGFHNNDKKFADKIFPYFDLRDPTKPKKYDSLKTQTLNVQDIYDTILTKNARFNLVLSDCCNDTVIRPKRMWWEPTKKKGLTKANFDNVKALFMSKQQVNYLMTAASKGEEAVVTPSFNSYFTYFFLQSLTTYLGPDKGFPTWPQVLAAAQSQTIKQVSGLPCKETNCPRQTPKMLIPGLK